ncbi:hypothetical protein AAF712_014023 [Marasmius tenuissimus]|uniref:Nephrocystin 3-like N-terminal domain-containing protein n=1 Tax=Marasmius tenuissimus TaxID=585030 RepID=A0ABR2ZD21_9AGAR
MTVAKDCEREGLLVSSFFFFRSDPMRNNPSALIPTISHGLVSTVPFMRRLIERRISQDPKILDANLEAQFRELIFKPTVEQGWQRRLWDSLVWASLLVLSWIARVDVMWTLLALLAYVPSLRVPNVVVIDGLDECSDERTQLRILKIICDAYREPSHFPLRFLICSRPESWIREAFTAEPLCHLTEATPLDESFGPDKDIRLYYLYHFRNISSSARHSQVQFPRPWPSREDLKTLVQRSGSQFVYASTLVRFIDLDYTHPISQLQMILANTPPHPGPSPYDTLDALYHVILSANPNHEDVLLILAAILIIPRHLGPSPRYIELLLGLPSEQVALMLRGMHSVLNIRGWADRITLYHTSFTDYLVTPRRSRHFHIDLPAKKDVLAQKWLQNLSTCKSYSVDQAYVRSFFTNWIGFFVSEIKPTRSVLDRLHTTDLASVFLHHYADWQKNDIPDSQSFTTSTLSTDSDGYLPTTAIPSPVFLHEYADWRKIDVPDFQTQSALLIDTHLDKKWFQTFGPLIPWLRTYVSA